MMSKVVIAIGLAAANVSALELRAPLTSFVEDKDVHNAAKHITGKVEHFGKVVSLLEEDVKTSYRVTKEVLHPWIKPLSASAVITTVALQLSPMPSSLQIRKARDVMRFDGYPYFTVLAGATQWCLYGSAAAYYSGDHSFLTMVAANGPGMFFGVFYITNFFKFVPSEDIRCRALRCYLFVGLMILVAQAVAVTCMHAGAVFWLGLLGSIGSAQIALSPFKTLPEVLQTRSTRSWPLDLCVWNFVQSLFTGSFGFANNDPWVWAPNVVGVLAAMVQLYYIGKFWEPKVGSDLKALDGKWAKDPLSGVGA